MAKCINEEDVIDFLKGIEALHHNDELRINILNGINAISSTTDVIEKEKIDSAIEEIKELPFVSSKTKCVDGVKVKGEWIETIYRDDVLKILERCLGE